MKRIPVLVHNKTATAPPDARIVCGNSDYVIDFTFDATWDEAETKTAVFTYKRYNCPYAEKVELDGNSVEVPVLYGIKQVNVGVYAGNLQTTTPARIPCDLSILDTAPASEGLHPTEAARINARIDALIASGFGAVPPNWNAAEGADGHVLNRTHWTEVSETVYLEETTLTVDEASQLLLLPDAAAPVEGCTYKVTWDGAEYTCVCSSFTQNGVTGLVFGNMAAMGIGDDTGEPFLFAYDPSAGMVVFPKGELESLPTVSIIEICNVVHRLPVKYLPEHLPYSENGVTEVFPETTVNVMGFDGSSSEPTSYGLVLEADKTYTVTWDGVDYVRTSVLVPATDGSPELVHIGNLRGLGGEDSGEPFVIQCAVGYGTIFGAQTSGTATVRITEEAEIIHKLSSKYLDVDWSATKTVVETTVLEETTITDSSGSMQCFSGVDINVFTPGANVKVTFDGVEYVCPVYVIEDADGVGNHVIYFGNGEPFMVWGYTAGTNAYYSFTEQDVEHTISIIAESYEYETLPEEYLPESVIQNSDKELILTSSTEGSTKKFKITVDDTGTLTATEVTE